ncbi:MAG: hypothetical protein ACE5HX_14065 [bacterium]
MGKKSRLKKEKRSHSSNQVLHTGMGPDGYHAFITGDRPSESELEKMTAEYRANIRKSPSWKEILRQFGEEKAEEILKECKVELRP